ncbi:MAG: hypothetical protein HYY43_06475 [Deltaproteobacteria bacterium]|nr:hypothetical protein [Deltaproteobacteria bacterium]MBI2975216.1 hypothetical protein [Deltaproteobacteria bacterium]
MGNKVAICFVFVLVAALSSQAFAKSWDFNYRNLAQFRDGRNNDSQIPVNQYISVGLSELPRNFSFQTDFRSFVDANNTADDAFDLYQAAFHIDPVDIFSIDAGRMWFADGFDATLIDGARFSLFPKSGYLGSSVYAGVPRFIETGDLFRLTEGLIVGTNLNLQNVKDTAAQLSAKWRKLDATKNDYKENDTIYLGLTASHQFSNIGATPNIYGDFEYDLAGKTINAGTAGVNLYPHWRIALTFEGNYFDVSRDSNETTIFGNYFSDELVQGRQAAQIKLMKNLHLLEDVSYQHYRIGGLGNKNGYTAGGGLDYYWEKPKLSSTGEYYYRKSFGGNVHGGLLELVNKYFEKLVADLSFDVSRYSKITGQDGTATSLVGLLSYQIAKRSFLGIGGEYNHNNWFDREGRLTINFEMGLDNTMYTPEKRSKKLNRRFHEI